MRGRDIESGPCSWHEFRHGRENLKLSGEELDPVGLYTWIAAFKNGAYKYPAIVFEADDPDENTGVYNVNFKIKDDEQAITLATSDSFFLDGMYMRERIKDGEHGIHTPTLILPGSEGIGGVVLTGYLRETDEGQPSPVALARIAEEEPAMPPTEEIELPGAPQRVLVSV